MIDRQVYKMHKAGNIKNLTLHEEKLTAPEAGEVSVAVKAIGLNFADIFAMQGLYSATPEGEFIPGLEFSGIISAIGEGVTQWHVGDRVMGATKFGGYVTHLNINENYVVALPESWDYNQGAGFIVQGLTAYYGLVVLGGLQKDMTVLIHSAAGGVGILANRICKKLGAKTIGTVGNASKVDLLKHQEGYDKVIVRDNMFDKKLQQALNNEDLMLVMECIGGRILHQSWEAMSPMARMVTYGSASFSSHSYTPNYPRLLWQYLTRPKIDPMKLPTDNKSIMGFNLIHLYDRNELLHSILDKLLALKIAPQHIGHVFDFEDMHHAIHDFQRGKTVGKVVLKTP